MKEWRYVQGYGFAHGNRAINLSGDGPITDDKQHALNCLNESAELAAKLEKEKAWRAQAIKTARAMALRDAARALEGLQ